MTHSFNLHDCAAKQRERDVIASMMADYLAKNEVRVIKGYTPKPRPIVTQRTPPQPKPIRLNHRQRLSLANQAAIFDAVKSGLGLVTDIAKAVGLSGSATNSGLRELEKLGRVKREDQQYGQAGKTYLYSLAEVEA